MLERNFSWVKKDTLAGIRGPTGKEDLEFLRGKGISVLVRRAQEDAAFVTSEQVTRFGMEDLHYPIPDYHPPTEKQIEEITRIVKDRISAGKKVAVSCGAGIGRTGTILTCILISMGHPLDEALQLMEKADRLPFETEEQRQAIVDYAKKIAQ